MRKAEWVVYSEAPFADANRRKVLRPDIDGFLCRVLLHVLPRGFARLRHCGLLANRHPFRYPDS